MLNQISSSSMPLFDIASKAASQSDEKVFKLGNNSHSLFVEIQHGNRVVFVRKTTVVGYCRKGRECLQIGCSV